MKHSIITPSIIKNRRREDGYIFLKNINTYFLYVISLLTLLGVYKTSRTKNILLLLLIAPMFSMETGCTRKPDGVYSSKTGKEIVFTDNRLCVEDVCEKFEVSDNKIWVNHSIFRSSGQHALQVTGERVTIEGTANYDGIYYNKESNDWQQIINYNDNEDGTITDKNTGIKFLKKTDCIKRMPWVKAMEAVNELSSGKCGLSDGTKPGDWRLPTKDELNYLFKWKRSPAPPEDSEYWSQNTYSSDPQWAWKISFVQSLPLDPKEGKIITDDKGFSLAVWPVRNDFRLGQ